MALPMDEQRILEEMERMLAADDPRLATKLAAFGQPGIGHVLRTRRARAVLSVLMLAVIACVAAVVYMVSAFRLTGTGPATPQRMHTAQPANTSSVKREAPAPTTAHCVTLVAPSHCTKWSSNASQPSAPPASTASETAKP